MKFEGYGDSRTGFRGHGEYEPGIDPPLSPCPFCGGRNLTVLNTHTPFYTARCEDCDAEGPRGKADYNGGTIRVKKTCIALHREAFELAIGLWNQREATEKP